MGPEAREAIPLPRHRRRDPRIQATGGSRGLSLPAGCEKQPGFFICQNIFYALKCR